MGTDCKAIAKLKDGSYLSVYLDRLYKFGDLSYDGSCGGAFNDLQPESEIDKNGVTRFVCRVRNIQTAVDWCKKRIEYLKLNKRIPKSEGDEILEHDQHSEQYIDFTEDLLKFLMYIRIYHKDNFEFVSIESDSDMLYEEIFCFDKDTVKCRELEFDRVDPYRKRTTVGGYRQFVGDMRHLRASRWELIDDKHPEYNDEKFEIFVGFPLGKVTMKMLVDVEAKKNVKIIKRIR